MIDENKHPTQERDEPVSIPLDPEDALKGLLAVKPEPVEQDEEPPQGDPLSD